MTVSCSDTAVDMSVDVLLIRFIIDILTGVGADMSTEVNTKVLAGVMTALEFVISETFKEFSCWAAFDCWPLALLDCGRVLQIWMPSYHV